MDMPSDDHKFSVNEKLVILNKACSTLFWEITDLSASIHNLCNLVQALELRVTELEDKAK